MSKVRSFEEYHRELKESLNESKIKKGADIVKIMSNPIEWGEDMQDRVFTKGQNFIFADTFYYGQQQALDDLVKSWSPGGRYYEYFKNDYGVEIEIIAKYSDLKAKGRFKKLTDDGVVYVELAIKNVNESVNEGISDEAAYIHQITGSGQAAAQDFIDDNNIDAKKLADYVKNNRNTAEIYNVRDIIAGTGVGANKSFMKRFIKQFLNESLGEEYDVSGLSRQNLKSILNYLDVNDISYSFDGSEEILSFDVTELDKAGQTQLKKWGLTETVNESDLYKSNNKKLRNIDEAVEKIACIECDEINTKAQWKKNKGFCPSCKTSSSGVSESVDEAKNNFQVTDFPEGSKIMFNDGEEWIVVKPGLRGSNNRRTTDEITIKPFNKLAKDKNVSLSIDVNIDYLNANVKSVINESYEEINEGVWANIMKGVRAGDSGPWSIVAIEYNKVVGQDIQIEIRDAIPAHYEDMKKKYPRAKLHIEDSTGGVVWKEK
jgi:hypothetical protein